jgi:hypothetical protein
MMHRCQTWPHDLECLECTFFGEEPCNLHLKWDYRILYTACQYSWLKMQRCVPSHAQKHPQACTPFTPRAWHCLLPSPRSIKATMSGREKSIKNNTHQGLSYLKPLWSIVQSNVKQSCCCHCALCLVHTPTRARSALAAAANAQPAFHAHDALDVMNDTQ